MTTPRSKPVRAWAIFRNGAIRPALDNQLHVYGDRMEARYWADLTTDVRRVEIREIPPASGRGRKKKGRKA